MTSLLRRLAVRFTQITGLNISRTGGAWELIEPELFLTYDRRAPDRFAAAVRTAAEAAFAAC